MIFTALADAFGTIDLFSKHYAEKGMCKGHGRKGKAQVAKGLHPFRKPPRGANEIDHGGMPSCGNLFIKAGKSIARHVECYLGKR